MEYGSVWPVKSSHVCLVLAKTKLDFSYSFRNKKTWRPKRLSRLVPCRSPKGKVNTIAHQIFRCLFKPDFPVEALIHRCSTTTITRITATLCGYVRSASPVHAKAYSDLDISPTSVTNFLAKDKHDSLRELRVEYYIDPIDPVASFRHLAMASFSFNISDHLRHSTPKLIVGSGQHLVKPQRPTLYTSPLHFQCTSQASAQGLTYAK